MIVGLPFDVLPSHVVASNVELETEWVAGMHALGDQRRVGDVVYEVSADPGTTDEPTAGAAADPPTWLRVDLANRYRAFNGSLGGGIERAGTIELTVQVPDVINMLFLSGMQGTSLRIEVLDGATVVADETYPLIDNTGVDNSWSFIYQAPEAATERVLQDLPSIFGANIRITLDAGAGAARQHRAARAQA